MQPGVAPAHDSRGDLERALRLVLASLVAAQDTKARRRYRLTLAFFPLA